MKRLSVVNVLVYLLINFAMVGLIWVSYDLMGNGPESKNAGRAETVSFLLHP